MICMQGIRIMRSVPRHFQLFLTGANMSRTSSMLPLFIVISCVSQPSSSEKPMANIWSNCEIFYFKGRMPIDTIPYMCITFYHKHRKAHTWKAAQLLTVDIHGVIVTCLHIENLSCQWEQRTRKVLFSHWPMGYLNVLDDLWVFENIQMFR